MLNINLAIFPEGNFWYVMSGHAVFGVFDTEAGARQAVKEARATAGWSGRNAVGNWDGEGGNTR